MSMSRARLAIVFVASAVAFQLPPLPPLHVAVEQIVVFFSARIVRFAYGECISQSACRVYHIPAGIGGPDGAGEGPGEGLRGALGASGAGFSNHARLKWYEFRLETTWIMPFLVCRALVYPLGSAVALVIVQGILSIAC